MHPYNLRTQEDISPTQDLAQLEVHVKTNTNQKKTFKWLTNINNRHNFNRNFTKMFLIRRPEQQNTVTVINAQRYLMEGIGR